MGAQGGEARPRPSPGVFAWGQEGKKPTRERRAGGREGPGRAEPAGRARGQPAITVTSTLGVQYG